MINIKDSKLYDLIPVNLRDDKDIIAAAFAVDNSSCSILSLGEKLDFRSNKEIKDHHILDALAIDLHVDFYDKSLSQEVKREIIDNSMILHMEKGTAGAVERALASVGLKGEVKEWYEYEGTPFSFKILLSPNVDLIKGDIHKIINSYKNIRSHFDFFEIKVIDIIYILRVKEYTFPVPYPVTGTFHTSSINGVASKATTEVETKEYTFQVPYPITGTFYCSEGGS